MWPLNCDLREWASGKRGQSSRLKVRCVQRPETRKDHWPWRTWEKAGVNRKKKSWFVHIGHALCRSGHTISKFTSMENAHDMLLNERVLSWVCSIIPRDCTLYRLGLSGASPTKPSQNLLGHSKNLWVHISEKPRVGLPSGLDLSGVQMF